MKESSRGYRGENITESNPWGGGSSTIVGMSKAHDVCDRWHELVFGCSTRKYTKAQQARQDSGVLHPKKIHMGGGYNREVKEMGFSCPAHRASMRELQSRLYRYWRIGGSWGRGALSKILSKMCKDSLFDVSHVPSYIMCHAKKDSESASTECKPRLRQRHNFSRQISSREQLATK